MGADVTVIGAGYGGLTTAAILAHNGVDVEVLESTGHLGGRATFDRKDGFTVDYGIHANRFASEGEAAAALREIGHEIDFLPMGEPLLYRGGSFVSLPSSVPQLLKSEFLSTSDKLLMASNMLKLVISNKRKNSNVTLDNAVWGKGRPEISSLLTVLSGIGIISPDTSVTSAGDFATFLKRALRAKQTVAYPRGGTSQIIEALAKKIEQSGKITLNSRAKTIEVKDGCVTSVSVKEELLDCRAVVAAFPVQKLPDLVPQGTLPESFTKRCRSLIPTAGVSIDLWLTENVSDIDGLITSQDPVTMGQFTSNIDPGTAPEGKQLATWYYPLPASTMKDEQMVEAGEKELLELLDRMFPGIMDKVERQRVLKLNMVDGAEPRVGQTAPDRPRAKVPGVENLFIAGDTVSATGSGGGDIAFSSGIEAARQVLAYLKRQVSTC